MVEERGEGLEQPSGEPLGVLGQVVPFRNAWVAGRELGVGRNDAAGQLSFVPFLSHFVPAGVESATILLEILGRRLVRFMDGAQRDICEKRLIGSVRLFIAQKLDRMVNQIFGDVVALFRLFGRCDVMIVFGQFGIELIGGAVEESVVAVESTL